MDTRRKGTGWIGNIYQKFEDMCLEVDELMQQEFEHVEHQLETVGANIKSFFSELELIGDELPQSSVDVGEGAAPDSSLVQNTDDVPGLKSLLGTDEDSGKTSLDVGVNSGSVEFVKSIFSGLSLEETDDIEMKKFQLQTSDKEDSSNASLLHWIYQASQETELDGGAKLLIPAPDNVGGCDSLMEAEDTSRNHADKSSNVSDGIRLSNSVNLVKPCKRCPAGIRSCPADALEISNSCLTTAAAVSSPDGIKLCNSSDESESTMRSVPFPEKEERDNDVTKSGLQTSQSSDKVKLDESCIIVGGTGIQCISSEEPNCRSYKKIFKEAFASKMRLLKKHHHKQHVDWSGDLDAGFHQQKKKSSTTPTVAEKSNSPDLEFLESEWEIV